MLASRSSGIGKRRDTAARSYYETGQEMSLRISSWIDKELQHDRISASGFGYVDHMRRGQISLGHVYEIRNDEPRVGRDLREATGSSLLKPGHRYFRGSPAGNNYPAPSHLNVL